MNTDNHVAFHNCSQVTCSYILRLIFNCGWIP